jgi:limonene 1,2-monooxygenase
MSYPDLKFGIYLAPFHALKENPTLALERDMALIELLDDLGYDSAWIGEHHSAGVEIIASPELFIAAAAQRTRHIHFGTGVSSLPYHHPLILADRIMQLDHMTRGRVSFGVGPGALASDAFMMGIKPQDQGARMLEAIEVLVPLLKGETVTHKTTWFELNEARLQLQPYTKPMVNMAVASQVSPASARAAGIHGLDLLSISATSAGGFNALATNWEIYARKAKQHEQDVDRRHWSLVGPVHIADSREQAFDNVRYGLQDWTRYFHEATAQPITPAQPAIDQAQAMVDSGMAVIGTSDDAIQQIQRLQKQSGGFGSFLQLAHNWADWTQTQRSYELFARHVVPHFQSTQTNRAASYEWASKNHDRFLGATEGTPKRGTKGTAKHAAKKKITKNAQEKPAK